MRKTVLSIVAVAVAGVTFAATRYVDAAREDDSGDGSSWETAKKTIQAAIDIAGKNDTVLIAKGTYLISSTLTMLTGDNKHIELRGATGKPADVVVDAQGLCPCLTNTAAMILNSITFQNGRSTVLDIAGGITSTGISLITNCVIKSCWHGVTDGHAYGGGLYLSVNNPQTATTKWPAPRNHLPMVVDTVVEGCAVVEEGTNSMNARGGGAFLYNYNSTGLTARNCVVTNFVSGGASNSQGAGAYLRYGTHVNDAFLDGYIWSSSEKNGYLSFGAGAYLLGDASKPVTLSDSLIAGNRSHGCGAGLGLGGYSYVDGCSVVSNRLSHVTKTDQYHVGGAGIYVYQANCCQIANTLVANNITTNDGNAVAYAGAITAATATNLVIQGCVVRDNVLQNAGALSFVSVGDLVVSNCVMAGNVATGDVSAIRFYSNQEELNNCGMGLITDCYIISNSNPRTKAVYAGGGILRYGASVAKNRFGVPLTVRNCLFAGNRAVNGSSGWGIRATFGENVKPVCDDLLTIDHCTFARNWDDSSYPNFVDFTGGADEHAVFKGCVFWENKYMSNKGERNAYISTSYLGARFTHCYADVTNAAFVVTAENGNMGPDDGEVRFVDADNLDFRLGQDSCLINKGGEFADWMGTGRRSPVKDLGASYVIDKVGKYGVSVSRSQATPRRYGSASDIGCCEFWVPAGFFLSIE